jgi:type IV pilus assembly protein PilY1
MFNQKDTYACLQKLSYSNWMRVVVIGFCVLTAGILFLEPILAYGQIDLADAPMFTKINPPPPNLMLLLDDSGSMTFEILVRGAYDGEFPNPDYSPTEGFSYVFDDMGDGYNLSGSWRQMDEETRKYWRSQWHATNAVYYNPNVVYEPWPSYNGETFLPADVDRPLVHPQKTKRLDLDKKSFTVDGVTVPWAHYFVSDTNGNPYLVILRGEENDYYTFTTDGGTVPNDKITTLTLVNPPDDIKKKGSDDRQNFANWFTYHRRREFVAKAAIARVIKELDSVRVGILGINHTIIAPLEPVEAVIDGQFKDETNTLIATLYQYQSAGGTPLKEGLRAVGEYYKNNDDYLLRQRGDAPYPVDGGACQQSFTIVVTDGYYSDVSYRSVGNADGNRDNEDWGGHKQPYMDDFSDTLADIAMYYYATDLRTDLDNQLPANKWDGAPHQHMVTFAVAFGVSGTLHPDDYEDDRTSPNYMKYVTKKEEPREYGDYVVWPKVPGDRRPESIDDLWHATVNGRGVFINAGEPQKLVEGLLHIIEDIKERQPTSTASVTVNGDWLFSKIGPDVLIFQGSYSYLDNQWSGDVKAYSLDQTTGEVIYDPVKWSAAQKLQSKDWNTRNIFTYDGEAWGSPFIYRYLTSGQKEKLGSDGNTGSSADVEAQNVVDFIRGKDPGSGDNRSNMLGDIVHSSPVFMDNVVYVGANDGMLHAFKASDGSELFAYVPNLVFDHLRDLADSAYEHRFYVDQTPTVQKGERLLDSDGIQTILVGGLGKGGKGYFALDITHPDTFSAAHDVLWEFPRDTDAQEHKADMGYSFGSAVVVRSYSANYPWIVIFGNGYDSENGSSVLFILDAKTGDLIRKIQAGTGPDNGLSSPIAVDVDFDEIVDFVYAGDLFGNLWKFDLTSQKATEWTVASHNGAEGVPLFSAADPDGNPQPITVKPDVMLHPEQHGLIVCFGTGKFLGEEDYSTTQIQTIYGIWDYGDRVFQPGSGWSPDDDKEYLGTFREPKITARLSNQPNSVKLLKQAASEVIVGSGEDEVITRVLTNEKPVWETEPDPDDNGQLPNLSGSLPNDAGWYLDLDVYSGERVIGDVLLRDGILIVIGFIPEQSFCGAGGESVFMELNAFTGGQLAGVQFDINDDGTVDENDLVEIEVDGKKIKVPPSGLKLAGIVQPPAIIKLNEKTEKKYLSTSSGGIVEVAEKTAKTGIAYWMEIRQ